MYVLEEPASRQAVDSSLKCEPCASTKSNGLLVFEATAAPLISTTSSVLHTAKLILFHLTKPKKGKKKKKNRFAISFNIATYAGFCRFLKLVV